MIAALVGLAGCDMLDMYNQPRYKTLSEEDFFANGQSARPLVEGTVARGQLEEDQAFNTGKLNDKYVDDIPDSVKVDKARPRAGPGSLQDQLSDVPRHDRLRRWRSRAARF